MNAEFAFGPDERFAALRMSGSQGDRDILVWEVGTDSLRPFAAEPGVQERSPAMSPDGRWLLYTSDRSGRDEVYAETFPGGGGRVQLSAEGGREPLWSRDGSRIFYRALDGWMVSARLTPALAVTGRDRLFDASPYLANQFQAVYDVGPDGRCLMIRRETQPARTDVVIFQVRLWGRVEIDPRVGHRPNKQAIIV